MASAGTQKVLRKLEGSLAEGQFYEAHEQCKTVYHRLRARRQAEDSYTLCTQGARLQLQRGQLNCGVELCQLLVEAYAADKLQPSDEAVRRLLGLVDAFPLQGRPEGADPPVQECAAFVSAAIKWLRSAGDWQHEAALEGRLAAYVTSALGWQGLGFALPHYARAGDAAAMAAAVATAASQGGSGEEDLFVARAALSMAAVQPPPAAPQPAAGQRQLDAAAAVVEPAYAAAAGHAAPDTPLLHFVGLFLEALRRQSEELVELLAQRYRPSLDRDPQLWQLMMKARAVHLPAAAMAAGGMGGLLGDLFGALAAPA